METSSYILVLVFTMFALSVYIINNGRGLYHRGDHLARPTYAVFMYIIILY